jgi:predicted Zn-dependent protease
MAGSFADLLPDARQRQMLYTQAAEYLAIASSIDRTSVEPLTNRAIILMRLSKQKPRQAALPIISDAIATLQRANNLKPDDPQIQAYLDFAEAEREARLAASTDTAPGDTSGNH